MRMRVRRSDRRSAVVLLAVLVAIVVLSLSAYQFSDRSAAEYQAADNAHQLVQARCFADSGVHMAAAMLADPDNIDEMLGGNPYDNPDHFRDASITPASGGLAGKFTLIAPPDPDDSLNSSSSRYGVSDEGGKINLNSMMKVDPSGDTLYNALLKLPNMTEEIAAAIVDWIDADTTPRENGAESDAYSGNMPSYRCKNGPLDSLDELLLVRGVTRDLLYGSDLNRNGVHDPEEAARGEYSRGWSAFLTVHSHEPNRDALGQTLLWINDADVASLYEKLAPEVGDELAKFVVLYRQYGPANAKGQQQSFGLSIATMFGGGSGGGGASQQANAPPVEGNLGDVELNLNKLPQKKINSMFDLVNVQVSIPNKDRKKPATIYKSPLNEPSVQKDMLGKLFQTATLFENSIVPARINVNTAPKEVLSAIPEMTEADVQLILSARSQIPFNSTPAWLLADAGMKLDTLRKIDKYVTTRTQVFRVHSVGQFADGKGPMARIEAIIDTNYGRPRIVQWRDWTELGKTSMPQQ